MKTRTAIATVAAVAGIALTGCTSTLQDLEGIEATPPDSYEVFQSPDLFPNIARVCVDGVAFVATTRDYQQVTRVPEWDAACGAKR
jgi:hypothetical protein